MHPFLTSRRISENIVYMRFLNSFVQLNLKMIISPRLAILFLASTAKAQTGIGQALNFNISSEVAQYYGCNETCQQVLAIPMQQTLRRSEQRSTLTSTQRQMISPRRSQGIY